MKKIIAFVFCLILLIQVNAISQTVAAYKKEAYEDASKRITLVVIMAEDAKKAAKPKKNVADDEMRKKDMETFNSQLQTAVKKWWKYTERYEFKSLAEVQKLAKGKTNKGYLVLQYVLKSEKETTVKPAPGAAAPLMPFNKISKPEACGYFEIRQAENMLPGKAPLSETAISFQAPNLFDDVFAIHALQYDLYNHMEGLSPNEVKANLQANAKNLLSKTLLIDKNDIAESTFNESKMKNLYPYEYLYVETDSCGDKLMEGNADFAVVKIVPTADERMLHYVISCEDGTVCAFYETKYEAKRRERIKAEALKAYSKYVK
jgi:hypothetical protein